MNWSSVTARQGQQGARQEQRPSPVVTHVTGWPSQQYGSFEHFLVALSRLVVERGGEMHLVFPAPPSSARFLEDVAATVHVIRSPTSAWDPRFLARVYGLLRRVGATHIHVHYGTDAVQALLAARLAGTSQRFFTKHNGPKRSRLSSLRHRLVARQVRQVLAVSRDSADGLKAIGVPTRKLLLVYLGTSTAAYRPDAAVREEARAENDLPADARVVLSTSHLRPGKGVELLPSLTAALAADPGSVVLLAAGTGQLRQHIEVQAELLGLGTDVFRLLGVREDVPRLLAAADLFVFPTSGSDDFKEGLGLGVLEAMAAGVPVVATAVTDLPELFKGTARFVPPGDLLALTAACRELLSSPTDSKDLAARARQLVQERFTVDAAAATYADLYLPSS